MIVGVCAAVVDIGATWMSDLKEGVCLDAFWLNREHCCWAANDTTFDVFDGCGQVTTLPTRILYINHTRISALPNLRSSVQESEFSALSQLYLI